MITKYVMYSSAIFMALIGLILTFAPDEILVDLYGKSDNVEKIILQLLGALYLSFAMTNWMTKDAIIGGIYNRPVALGNFLHFLMGGFALARLLLANYNSILFFILTFFYVLFAIAFYFIVFRHPKLEKA